MQWLAGSGVAAAFWTVHQLLWGDTFQVLPIYRKLICNAVFPAINLLTHKLLNSKLLSPGHSNQRRLVKPLPQRVCGRPRSLAIGSSVPVCRRLCQTPVRSSHHGHNVYEFPHYYL